MAIEINDELIKQWENILTNEQNEIICEKFKAVMERFKYI